MVELVIINGTREFFKWGSPDVYTGESREAVRRVYGKQCGSEQ